MTAFDLRHVQEPGIVTDQHRTPHRQLRQRCEAALDDGACAIRDTAATGDLLGDERVVFEALELVKRAEMRVGIRQINNQTQRNLIVLEMIEVGTGEEAAKMVARPAHRVHDFTRHMVFRRNIPQFLESDAVVLSARVLLEIKFRHQLFTEMAAAAFSKHRVFGAQLVARFERRFLLAVGAHAHVAGRDPGHRTVVVIENLGGGKPGKDVYPQGFGLFAQPAAHIAETDCMIAMIVRRLWHEEIGHLDPIGVIDEVVHLIGRHRIGKRRAAFSPVGKEFVEGSGFHNRTRQNVCADLGAFLHQTHRHFPPGLLCQLHEPASCCESRRASADDHHIKFHGFSCHVASPNFWLLSSRPALNRTGVRSACSVNCTARFSASILRSILRLIIVQQ